MKKLANNEKMPNYALMSALIKITEINLKNIKTSQFILLLVNTYIYVLKKHYSNS